MVDGLLPRAHAAAADAADAPVVDLLLAALDATLEQMGLGCEPCPSHRHAVPQVSCL